MVAKEHILAEIKRTAEENGGVALGRTRFRAETGIRESDWRGRFWINWSEALKEAGYQPRALQKPLDEEFLLEKLATLVRQLGHFPVRAELQLSAREDPSFPSPNVFYRLGKKAELAAKVMELAASQGDEDVASLCAKIAESKRKEEHDVVERSESDDDVEFGFVYLLKSGRFYKIGRTNSAGRRERELAIQLPEKATMVHQIKTDDPVGIELYWHRRFQDRHKNGEWFELTRADVSAFRRRKFM